MIQTDHKPLVFILSVRNVLGFTLRIARLSKKLLQFDFIPEYISRGKNICADYLSRYSEGVGEYEESEKEEDKEDCIVKSLGLPQVGAFLKKDWYDALKNDSILDIVMKYVESGWSKERNLDFYLKTFVKVEDELSVEDGLLFRADKLVPPV